MKVQDLQAWRIRVRLGARFLEVLRAFVEAEQRRAFKQRALMTS